MRPLDLKTRMLVTDALTRAAMTDRDAAEYLNAHGLLASDEWCRTVQADAIATLAERWMSMPPLAWHPEHVAKWWRQRAKEIRGGTGR